eukprot:5382334-Prymnesium_polylepis.1
MRCACVVRRARRAAYLAQELPTRLLGRFRHASKDGHQVLGLFCVPFGLLDSRAILCDQESPFVQDGVKTASLLRRRLRLGLADFLGFFAFSLAVRMCRFFRGIAGVH